MSETIAQADPLAAEQLTRELAAGRLAVVPTDTRYAIVADAFTPQATRRLMRARGAGRNRPVPVLIGSRRQLDGLAEEVTATIDRLAEEFWPGPLTLIVRAAAGLTWDLGNTLGTVAVRLPDEPWLQEVLVGHGPLAATGACRRGRPQADHVEAARTQLGDTVALYIDAGVRAEPLSTVVDLTRGQLEVRRVGAIAEEDLTALTTSHDRTKDADPDADEGPDPAADTEPGTDPDADPAADTEPGADPDAGPAASGTGRAHLTPRRDEDSQED